MARAEGDALTLRDLLPKLLSSDAWALALLSVSGTAATFFVEYGYLAYYAVPKSLVQIDVTRIVFACAVIGFVSIGLMGVVLLILGLLRGSNPVKKALVLPIFASLVFGLLAVISGQWWTALGGAVLIFMVTFLPPLFFKDDGVAGYALQLFRRTATPDLILGQRVGLGSITLMVMSLYIVAVLLSGIGHKIAESRELYFVLADDPTMALVDTYGDTAIFVSFDPETRRLLPLARVVPMVQSLELVPVYTGALLRQVHEDAGCDGAELLGFGVQSKTPYQCFLRRYTSGD